MTALDESIRLFDSSVNNLMANIDGNEYLASALALFLIIYAGLAAPKLPSYIARLFDNAIFRFVLLFLVAYSANKNPTVAVIAAVALIVSIMTLNRLKFNNYMNLMMVENLRPSAIAEERAASEARFEEGFNEEESVASAGSGGCNANWRNNFYPQYAQMQPDAYMARYTGDNVSGYDPSAAYNIS
jgi:hypothetical protein